LAREVNTKEIALPIVFAALAIVLNPAISGVGVPFLFTGYIYNVWEIVIMVAFLLMGFKSGISVALLNAAFLLSVYPGPSRALFPWVNTIAVSSMMVGVYLASKLTRKNSQGQNPSKARKITLYTALAITLRLIVMLPIVYALLHFHIGATPPSELAIFMIAFPLQTFYNVTITLYTVPVAYFIAKTVSKNLKVGTKF
jgi:riboflavin transporter FmnP